MSSSLFMGSSRGMVVPASACDERGVPLDWEKCRTCNVDSDGTPIYPYGTGGRDFPPADAEALAQEMCPTCGGHGSLRAAALAALEEHRLRPAWRELRFREREARGEIFDKSKLPQDKIAALDQIHSFACSINRASEEDDASFVLRCEDCGHLMSEGTWDGPGLNEPSPGPVLMKDPLRVTSDQLLASAAYSLRSGNEPNLPCTHFTPCDEECTHGGPGRVFAVLEGQLDRTTEFVAGKVPTILHRKPEASWRQVDVRVGALAFDTGLNHTSPLVSRPFDLRIENLALLCTRCFAERTKTT